MMYCYQGLALKWTFSSGGQSHRLISDWSEVQVLQCPPYKDGEVSLMVKRWTVAPVMRVRFSYFTPYIGKQLSLVGRTLWEREGMGSNPIFPAIYATIAQLAVQLTCNQEVGGSIPSGGTIYGEVCLVAMAPDCKSGTLETPVVRIRPSPPFQMPKW